MKKFWAWLQATWLAMAIAWIGKQIWSVISDIERDADPWKIAALGFLVLGAIGGIYIFRHVEALSIDKLGVLSSLVGACVTVATILFGQSRKSDAALLAKNQPPAPPAAQGQ